MIALAFVLVLLLAIWLAIRLGGVRRKDRRTSKADTSNAGIEGPSNAGSRFEGGGGDFGGGGASGSWGDGIGDGGGGDGGGGGD